jgi:hypothetical protein
MKQEILGYRVDTHSVEECADSVFATLQGKAGDRGRCAWLAVSVQRPHLWRRRITLDC